jgi:FkbM family methyltransferase
MSKWQWYGNHIYSQHGDEVTALNIFKRIGVETGSYVDVGAHHPTELSNTALMYQRGWRGVNVDANIDVLETFMNERPLDKNVWCAVTDTIESKVTLYREHPTSGINSLIRENVWQVRDEVRVPSQTLHEIIQHDCGGQWPDFLSIDAEGMDVRILRSVTLECLAKVICVEAVSQHGDCSDDIRSWSRDAGYYVHSWTGHNMMLVRCEYRELLH